MTPNALLRSLRIILLLVASGVLGACLSIGDARAPIASELIPAPAGSNQVLVIVLPGRGDDLAQLRRSGIAAAIQQAWPEADVLLTEVSLPYYAQGRMPERFHEEIVLPARQRGYRQVWLAGASIGGTGVLLYDRRYPGEMDGLVLLAPFLGDRVLLKDIAAAGGLTTWEPGPTPSVVTTNNYQRELWRYLKGWNEARQARGQSAWLVYGDQDPLRAALPALKPLFPTDHVLIRPGGHAWAVWAPAAGEIFRKIASDPTGERDSR